MSDAKTLRILRLPGHDIEIEPAPVRRHWMDRSPDRYAYRCLPLNIANAHGWQVLCPADFWVRLKPAEGDAERELEFDYDHPAIKPAVSHFGMGIITFHIPALVRTPPGYALYVTGPVNGMKPGATPLSGIVETDWLPFTFTMNWRLSVAGPWIEFKKGAPFCMFFPVQLNDIERFDVTIEDLADEPELMAEHKAYAASRQDFLKKLAARDADTVKKKWERKYTTGEGAPEGMHRTALKLATPKRLPRKTP